MFESLRVTQSNVWWDVATLDGERVDRTTSNSVDMLENYVVKHIFSLKNSHKICYYYSYKVTE